MPKPSFPTRGQEPDGMGEARRARWSDRRLLGLTDKMTGRKFPLLKCGECCSLILSKRSLRLTFATSFRSNVP